MASRGASILGASALALLLLLDGREVVLDNLDPRIKAWVTSELGADEVTVGSIGFSLGSGAEPAGLTLNDVRIAGIDTAPTMTLPRVETGFQVLGGLSGQVRPTRIDLQGVAVSLGRGLDGSLNLSAGGERAQSLRLLSGPGGGPGFAALLQASDLFHEMDMLSQLDRVDIGDLALSFRDARSGTTLRARGATAYISRTSTGTSAGFSAEFEVPGVSLPVAVQATLQERSGQGVSRYAISFDGARPADIASQISVLSWMHLLDARVDGALSTEVDNVGAVLGLSGALRISSGYLRPKGAPPMAFGGASMHFAYDPGRNSFQVSALEIDTQHGRFRASGDVLVERDDEALVRALVAQLELQSITLAADSLLAGSVSFPRGSILARIGLDPFAVEIGMVEVNDGPARLNLTGSLRAEPSHWAVSLDASLAELSYDRLLALWPQRFRPGLRNWLSARVEAGRVTRFDAFFRQTEEGRRGGLDFAFRDAQAWVLEDMPPIVGGAGQGQVLAGRVDLTLEAGRTGGGALTEGIDLAGSRFTIADARQKPATAEVALSGIGPLAKALQVVDRRPLGFLTRAGLRPTLATGTADVRATLAFPLRKGLRAANVTATVTAGLSDVFTDQLIPGRTARSEALSLTADNAGLQLTGGIELARTGRAAVPIRISYARSFGPGADPGAVQGDLAVTAQSVADLGIPLPPGALSGGGQGSFMLTLRPDAPPLYSADVNLAGAGVSIAALGWQKAPGAAGRLTLGGALAATPTVERISLIGPGLTLAGALDISGTGLTRARLSRLALGGWLDAPVTWSPGRGGRSNIAIRGGRIDLRGGLPPQVGAGGAGIDLTLRPDEIVVADKIRLRGVRGQINSGARPLGRFTASLNGQVPLSGYLRTGGEVFLQSDNGGAALRAAGVFRNAFGGTLRVSLKSGNGPLSGLFSLRDATVVRDPGLSTLLQQADAQGLARRVQRSGIGIDDAQGRFSIANGMLRLSAARAVGPTLGITLAGDYGLRSGQIDMEGVVSPLFAINGVVQRLPLIGRVLGGRPGEGLLGATFRITGSGEAPQIAVNPLSLLTPGAAREIFQTRARN